MAAELDGPRLEPRSVPARALVVFLHGYGADGNDLIDIGRAWQGLLPHAAFVSPHAPEACAQAPVGRQWFPLTFRDPNERWTGVNKAAPVLTSFLDAELKRRNLAPSALALVGFSQGTMMALHVGLRRAAAPFAIVGYSGLLALPPDANPEKLAAEVKSRPPVLLVHRFGVRLREDRPHHRRHERLRALGDTGEQVAHEVRPAALPARAGQRRRDRVDEARMRDARDELGA